MTAHRGDRGGGVSIQLGREGAPERAEDHKTLPRSSERHFGKVKKKHLEACLSISALISKERNGGPPHQGGEEVTQLGLELGT